MLNFSAELAEALIHAKIKYLVLGGVVRKKEVLSLKNKKRSQQPYFN